MILLINFSSSLLRDLAARERSSCTKNFEDIKQTRTAQTGTQITNKQQKKEELPNQGQKYKQATEQRGTAQSGTQNIINSSDFFCENLDMNSFGL